jgi:predicted DCC family thiol-disulfide oxidoreductase YuxK
MRTEVTWPLRIYYDAGCPLCAAEMHGLRDRDTQGRLQLVDCSAQGFEDAELAAAGIEVQTALNHIHALDAAGRWHRGVAVFELAYAAAGLGWMARLLSQAWLRPLLEAAYPLVVRSRGLLAKLGLVHVLASMIRRGRAVSPCTDSTCPAEPSPRKHP